MEKGLSRTGEYPSASPGGGGVRAGFMERSQERMEGSDWTEVCEAWEHLTEAGAGQAAGENHEVPSIPRGCYGREHRVSVACVT